MANYTTRVYDILRFYDGNNETPGYTGIENAIENHWQDIFDIDIWNTWDSTYKGTLAQKILRHYLMYEIGSETVSLWKINLNSKMSEIMPKYNVMYRNIEKAYDNFFSDVDYTETEKRDIVGSGTSTGTSKDASETSGNSETNTEGKTNQTTESNANGTATETSDTTSKTSNSSKSNATSKANSDGWQESSDTPQGALTDLENQRYLSSAVHNKASSDNTSDSDNTAEATGENTTNGESTTQQSETGKTESSNSSTQTATGTSTTTATNETNSKTDSSSTENYVKTVIGKMGSENNARLFNEICSSINNIDEMIINELSECFLLLWE
jgi:hypothetical protein